jgi:REP element-mobilizing transposase RayT
VNPAGRTIRPAPPVHRRQGLRCAGRDYRIPAFYLITMTALDRKPRFARCENDRCELTDEGRLVQRLWQRISTDYPQIRPCALVIMPDHLHGILRVKEYMAKPLGVPLRAFKSQVTSALRKRYVDPA